MSLVFVLTTNASSSNCESMCICCLAPGVQLSLQIEQSVPFVRSVCPTTLALEVNAACKLLLEGGY